MPRTQRSDFQSRHASTTSATLNTSQPEHPRTHLSRVGQQGGQHGVKVLEAVPARQEEGSVGTWCVCVLRRGWAEAVRHDGIVVAHGGVGGGGGGGEGVISILMAYCDPVEPMRTHASQRQSVLSPPEHHCVAASKGWEPCGFCVRVVQVRSSLFAAAALRRARSIPPCGSTTGGLGRRYQRRVEKKQDCWESR